MLVDNNYYLAAEGSTCKYSKHHGEGSISSWTGNCSSVKRLSAAAQAMVSSVKWNTGAIHYGDVTAGTDDASYETVADGLPGASDINTDKREDSA